MNGNPMQFLTQLMSMGRNPQEIVNNLMQQNPRFQQIMKQVQNSGMNPTQYLNQYAKQNGMESQVAQMMNIVRRIGK